MSKVLEDVAINMLKEKKIINEKKGKREEGKEKGRKKGKKKRRGGEEEGKSRNKRMDGRICFLRQKATRNCDGRRK